jgi:cell division protein FtsB
MYKLENDNEYLEKFAREHYHMKNKNEEIFIIKD